MTIQEICNKYNITNYTINDDGSIDVDGDVDLSYRKLTKLPLKFNSVSGDFYCYNNNLTTLSGSPEHIGGNFSCSNNKLTNLEGSPQSVSGYFGCYYNNLTTLKGSPKSVGGDFYCRYNNLTSLEYYPENLGGNFHCSDNPIGFISKEMDIDFIKAFNTFKVLKDNTINLKRLKYIMEMFNKPINLEEIKKHYELI